MGVIEEVSHENDIIRVETALVLNNVVDEVVLRYSNSKAGITGFITRGCLLVLAFASVVTSLAPQYQRGKLCGEHCILMPVLTHELKYKSMSTTSTEK